MLICRSPNGLVSREISNRPGFWMVFQVQSGFNIARTGRTLACWKSPHCVKARALIEDIYILDLERIPRFDDHWISS